MRIDYAEAKLLVTDLKHLHEQNQNCTIWFDTDDNMYHIKERLEPVGIVEHTICKFCKGHGSIKLDRVTNHPQETVIAEKCLTCDGTGRI